MTMIRLSYGTAILLLVMTSASLAEEPTVSQLTFFGAITQQGEPTGHLVDVTEQSCQQTVRRVLIETPVGDRVVLERQWVPSTGLHRWRLTDDASGWWMEIHQVARGRFELPSFWSLGASTWLLAQRMKALEEGSTAELRVEGDVVVALDVPPHELAGPVLARAAAAQGLHRAWREQWPPERRSTIRFLLSFYRSHDPAPQSLLNEYEGLLDVLRLALPDEPADDASKAPQYGYEAIEAVQAPSLIPRAQALASRFTTLSSPVDLLIGLHAPEDGGCPSATGE